ncbi:MAG: histidine phosphatase family protein [Planctomycetota bacterium]
MDLSALIPSRRRIYLLRHADVSYFDASGKPARPDSVPLTEKGRTQADAAQRALAEIPIDKAICSGLPRTVETARKVVGERSLEIEAWHDFREIEPGRLSELPLDSIGQVFLGSLAGNLDREGRFLGGETFGSMLDRVLSSLDKVIADPGWSHLLLVAHGAVNRAILCHALGSGLGGFGGIEQDACCINIIDVDQNGRLLVRLLNHTPYDHAKVGMRRTTMEQLLLDYMTPGSA